MAKDENIRVWMDGCFDLFHFGHANALRQAKELGDELIVGIHNDEEITVNKGPPVFTEDERYRMLRSIKWIDEIVEAVPYTIDVKLLIKHNCNFCTHGDDIAMTPDGLDSFHVAKSANMFKEFKRTQGISTTELISRILNIGGKNIESESIERYPNLIRDSDFLATSIRIAQFQYNLTEPKPDDIILYAPGCYDLLHVGHCMFLEQCTKLGTYIIVGLYSDDIARAIYGREFPIMTLYERLLSILSCKYVSDVVINPPYKITEDMMKTLRIDFVVHGKTNGEKLDNIFEVPKRMGKFRTVDSKSDLTLELLISRIKKNSEEYQVRNKNKEGRETNGK